MKIINYHKTETTLTKFGDRVKFDVQYKTNMLSKVFKIYFRTNS